MSQIDYSFLISGQEWDESEITNLGFSFSGSTPSSFWYLPEFILNYEISQSGAAFTGYSNASLYDQKDAVRYFLTDPDDLDDFTGADTVNVTLVASAGYRVSFSDVIDAHFSEDVDGEVQLVNHQGNYSTTKSFAQLPEATVGAGDIVINYLDPGYDDLAPGEVGFWLLLHELGHAIGGLEHSTGSAYDSQKYTTMSYNSYGFTHASGLQLLDIAALQDTYGSRNYSTRGDNTEYKLGQGLGFYGATSTDPYLYTIWDGAGNDTIDASDFLNAATIDLRQGSFSTITESAANENVAIAYYTVIENARGTNSTSGDTLIGNAWDNVLEGLAGNDHIYGDGVVYDNDAGFHDNDTERPGPDAATNDSGNDTLIGGAGDDMLYGGDGTDTASYRNDISGAAVSFNTYGNVGVVDGWGDTDTLIDIENVTGSAYADLITGDSGDNVLSGNAGDDTLIGGAGNDTLAGGDGLDTVDYSAVPTNGVIINLTNIAWDHDSDTLTAAIAANTAHDGQSGFDTLSSIEVIKGTEQADYINGSNIWGNTIYGFGGDDYILGGALADYIDGGDGNDTIIALGDVDTIYGGNGDDSISGSGGDDTIYGGDGVDNLNGKEDDDIIYGDAGNDTIRGDEGNDELHGGDGDDLIYGGTSTTDTFYSDDVLYGDAGVDMLYGLNGNDVLDGGDGNDYLFAGAGDDILYTSNGQDVLRGEGGDDIFFFVAGTSTQDIIKDFNVSTEDDKLDVSELVDFDPMTDVITDFVQITESGGHSYLYVDSDGGANSFTWVATLQNITGITDEAALLSSGNLIAA